MGRKIVNEGNNGFHVVTVVTDGYGNLIAEDAHGSQIAQVPANREYSDRDVSTEAAEVVRKAFVEFAHREAADNA